MARCVIKKHHPIFGGFSTQIVDDLRQEMGEKKTKRQDDLHLTFCCENNIKDSKSWGILVSLEWFFRRHPGVQEVHFQCSSYG